MRGSHKKLHLHFTFALTLLCLHSLALEARVKISAQCSFGITASRINPIMPNGAFNICCPRDCVSRHNGGTSGAPLKPLRVDSALNAPGDIYMASLLLPNHKHCLQKQMKVEHKFSTCRNALWKGGRQAGRPWQIAGESSTKIYRHNLRASQQIYLYRSRSLHCTQPE